MPNKSEDDFGRHFCTKAENDLSGEAKWMVLRNVCWCRTTDNGRRKKKGCRYWSRKAIDERTENAEAKVIHEHVVPINVLIHEMLMKLEDPEEQDVSRILNSYAIGCVVTKQEDQELDRLGFKQKMPEEFWASRHPFVRHEHAGIEIAHDPEAECTQKRQQ